MIQAIETLHYVCIINLVCFSVFLFIKYREDIRVKIVIVFLFCVICFLTLSLNTSIHFPKYLKTILFIPVSTITFFYWLLSLSIFRDKFSIKPIYILLLFVKISVSLAVTFVRGNFNSYENYTIRTIKELGPSGTIYFLIPILFSFGFIFASILQTYIGEKTDLVEERLKLRKKHLYISGSIIVFIVLSTLFAQNKNNFLIIDLINIIIINLGIYIVAFSLLEIREGIIELKKDPIKVYDIDIELKNKILNSFEIDKIYKNDGLTIKQLSEKINEHEYKVRKLINHGLGYKNFNDFLNKYRIQDACETLLTQSENSIPIVRIAMDLGYQSLGPFNKAFKEQTGVTPREYRKNKIG